MFNEDKSALNCLLCYSALTNSYEKSLSLDDTKHPNYFKFIKKNQVVVSNDSVHEKVNMEILDSYLLPIGIKSMLYVPLRSGANMIGVICFEQVGELREWNHEEQKFGQSIAQLVSLVLETQKNREYREKLERLIIEKDLLLSEINHRVKNNITIILSLINLQKIKVKDEYHQVLFEEIKNKVFSISTVQEQLHLSEHFDRIDAKQYLNQLVSNLNDSFGKGNNMNIILDLESVFIDITKAIPFGLITNELITNSFKYAFGDDNVNPTLAVSFVQKEEKVILTIKDNGSGVQGSIKNGMGLNIVESLCDQIDATICQSSKNGFETIVTFSVK